MNNPQIQELSLALKDLNKGKLILQLKTTTSATRKEVKPHTESQGENYATTMILKSCLYSSSNWSINNVILILSVDRELYLAHRL